MTETLIRDMEPNDAEFRRRMCYEAAYAHRPAPRPTVDEGMTRPSLRRYVEDWGQSGDAGVVAVGPDGERLGAAWYRLFPAADPSYGWIAAEIPELVLAVVPEARGMGLGTRPLRARSSARRTTG